MEITSVEDVVNAIRVHYRIEPALFTRDRPARPPDHLDQVLGQL
jgi:hypothetical protein